MCSCRDLQWTNTKIMVYKIEGQNGGIRKDDKNNHSPQYVQNDNQISKRRINYTGENQSKLSYLIVQLYEICECYLSAYYLLLYISCNNTIISFLIISHTQRAYNTNIYRGGRGMVCHVAPHLWRLENEQSRKILVK